MIEPAVNLPPIPKETARTANAIFGKNNFFISVGDRLEAILEGVDFECLFESASDPRCPQAILSLISFFQFAESLTDVQAADAVRARIEWKYALHLPVNTPVIQESELCKFRWMLWANPEGQHQFQKMVSRFIDLAPLCININQNFSGLQILAVVCTINQVNAGMEAFSRAIEVLANRFPEWLLKNALPQWYGRYNRPALEYGLSDSLHQQKLSILEVSADIHHLLKEVRRTGSREINNLWEIRSLESIWSRQIDKELLPIMNESAPSRLKACDFCMISKGGYREKNLNG